MEYENVDKFNAGTQVGFTQRDGEMSSQALRMLVQTLSRNVLR